MILGTLILVGLLAATYVALGRMVVENTNRTVGLAVDYAEVERLAAATATAPVSVLQRLQEAGATHLAVSEDDLQTLLGRGQVAMFAKGNTVEIWFASAKRLHQAAEALSNKLPGEYAERETEDGDRVLEAPFAATSVPNVGVGYPPEALEAARKLGLHVVARPHWQGVRTPRAVTATIEQAAEAGAQIVVFTGDQVIGHPNLIETTAQALMQKKVAFGLIELAPQKGAAKLAAKLHYRVVRVHSVTEPEMHTILPQRAVERFVRAAREREVRLLYLRLLPGAEDQPAKANATYVTAIREGLKDHGLQTGAPRPLADFGTPPWLLALVLLGAWGGALWLMQALFGLPPEYFWVLTLLAVVGGSAGAYVADDLARSLGALTAATVFPLLAVLYAAQSTTPTSNWRPRLLHALGPLLSGFLKVSVITAFGGLLVVGALGDSSYLVKVAQFRGVKLAQVIPLAVVALVWLARSTGAYRNATPEEGPDLLDRRSGITRPEWPALWPGLREAFSEFIAYWHVAAAVVGLALLGLLIVRSGNEAAGAILPGELQFRALLDKLLVVRPRTKEVFLGHPVMILTLLLALRGARRGLWVGFALGTIGQISILNSCCHLHTPLLLTLVRIFNGLWLGALAGIVLCTIWDLLKLPPRPDRAAEPAMPPDDEDQG